MKTHNLRNNSLIIVKSKSSHYSRRHPLSLLLKSCCVSQEAGFIALSSQFCQVVLERRLSVLMNQRAWRRGNKKHGLAPSIFSLLHFDLLFSGFGFSIDGYQLCQTSCTVFCVLLLQGSLEKIEGEKQSVGVPSASSPLKRLSRLKFKKMALRKSKTEQYNVFIAFAEDTIQIPIKILIQGKNTKICSDYI